MSEVEVLSVAVCLFPNVTALDYQGPVELFGFITPENIARRSFSPSPSKNLRLTYLSHSLDPVHPVSGPPVLPEATYKDATTIGKQFDILLVPGGPGARPGDVPGDVIDFIKQQAPSSQYVLSVCTGSWILAGTGILDGKRATTNKSAYKACKAATSDKIEWVPKARWIVDDSEKIWTSSGVTAGMDMANAFLIHLVGSEVATKVRGIVELSARSEGDDEFAEYYGLV